MKLRELNEQEKASFAAMYKEIAEIPNPIFESILDKMYRHQYCLVGHEMTENVQNWFKTYGLNTVVSETDRIFTTIQLGEEKKFPRTCDKCGCGMDKGFVIDGGLAYYCGDNCLFQVFTEDEWEEAYADGTSDSYYTDWFDIEEE